MTKINKAQKYTIIIGVITFIIIFIVSFLFANLGKPFSEKVMNSLEKVDYYKDLLSLESSNSDNANITIKRKITNDNNITTELTSPYLIIKRNNMEEYKSNFKYVYSNEEKRLSNIKTIVIMCDEGGKNISQYYNVKNSNRLYINNAALFYYNKDLKQFFAYEEIQNKNLYIKTDDLPKTLSGNMVVTFDEAIEIVKEHFAR